MTNQFLRKYFFTSLFVVALFTYLLHFIGVINGRIILFGNSSFVSLSDFEGIFRDLGGPAKVGDGGWHLRVAQELATQNFVQNSSFWWLTASSPGLGVIEGLFLKVFGFNSFAYSYLIFLALLWTILFGLVFGRIQSILELFAKFVLFIVVLQYTGIESWMLGHGAFFSEALATPFFLISVGLAFRAFTIQNVNARSLLIGISATFLAVAAFVRGSYLYVSYGFFLLGFLVLIYTYVKLNVRGVQYRFPYIESTKAFPLILFLVGIGTQLALLPYFIFSRNYLGTKFGSLNSTDFHLQYAWIDPAKDPFKTIGAGWLCSINKQYCQQDFSSSASHLRLLLQDVFTFLSYPQEVITSRFQVFVRAWFSSESPGATGSYDAVAQGVLFIVAIILIVALTFQSRNVELRILSGSSLFILFLLICPLFLTHIEVRFLIPFKSYLIFYLLYILNRTSLEFNFKLPRKISVRCLRL